MFIFFLKTDLTEKKLFLNPFGKKGLIQNTLLFLISKIISFNLSLVKFDIIYL